MKNKNFKSKNANKSSNPIVDSRDKIANNGANPVLDDCKSDCPAVTSDSPVLGDCKSDCSAVNRDSPVVGDCKSDCSAVTSDSANHITAPKAKKARVWELDFLRGLSIIMVVWDHIMFDIAYMFGANWLISGSRFLSSLAVFAQDYHNSDLRAYGWIVFVFIFFFVAGISSSLSKNNLARGIKLALVAGFVTLVTWVLELMGASGALIILGVLHCLSFCILIYAVIEIIVGLFNRRKNKWVLPIVLAIATIIALVMNQVFNVSLLGTMASPSQTVISDCKIAGLFVFTESWWRATADYFPLLPFLWFFLLGAVVGKIFYTAKKSLLPKLDGKWHCIFTFAGRHSLIIYLGLQVVAVALLALISLIITGSTNLSL